ncbi:MAG: YidC/Oxa1 family membrane protein insertase [Clostridia bacterium]|nr:YidC/Oxa1 family membrane protein insertase [Clostridia bacterium]
MNLIFGYIGYAFGYVLWLLYQVVSNYGVAIILFTLISKIVLLPFSIKQQKSMTKNASFTRKQQEIRQKYANDRQKMEQEISQLYQKEGISPTGGCLTMLAPFIIMFGVFYVVRNPLTNALHIDSGKVTQALEVLKQIPGVGVNFGNSMYGEIDIIKHFDQLKSFLPMFSESDVSSIEFFSKGFNFLGLDLLGTPSQSSFSSMLWLIPVLCLVSSWASQFIMQKLSGQAMQQQGCMKYSLYLLPLISVYFSYIVPAAVGFYWVMSTLFSLVQSIILNKFYSAGLITAKSEAARVVLREQQEKSVNKI